MTTFRYNEIYIGFLHSGKELIIFEYKITGLRLIYSSWNRSSINSLQLENNLTPDNFINLKDFYNDNK